MKKILQSFDWLPEGRPGAALPPIEEAEDRIECDIDQDEADRDPYALEHLGR